MGLFLGIKYKLVLLGSNLLQCCTQFILVFFENKVQTSPLWDKVFTGLCNLHPMLALLMVSDGMV